MVRHISLLMISISAFFASTKAQYKPMLGDSISTWYVTSCNSSKTQCGTDFYSAIGDTVISGLDFKFLDDFHFNRSVLMREDTTTGKVYLRPLFGFRKYRDVLLYDFSLEKGDAIEVYNPNSPIPDSLGYFKVDSTDFIISLQGDSLKRLFLSREPANDDYSKTIWLEGVGSLSLLNTPGQFPDITGVGEVGCFFLDGTHRYESTFINQNQGDCKVYFSNSTTSTSQLNEDLQMLGLAQIEDHQFRVTNSIEGEPINIEVYTLTGKLLFETRKSPEEVFSLSGLSQGFYLVRLNQAGTSNIVKLRY